MATHMPDQLRVPAEVVDKILDHVPAGPAVRRRYNKSQLLEQRREALQLYADWIDGLPRRNPRVLGDGIGTGGPPACGLTAFALNLRDLHGRDDPHAGR